MKLIHPAALAALSLVLVSGAAHADDWPMVRHDAQNSGATVESLRPPFVKAWSRKNVTNEPLLVAGNTLLFTSRRGMGLRDLQAVTADTGKPLWTVPNVTQTGAASPSAGMVFTVIRTTAKPTSVSKLGANLWHTAVAGVDLKTGKVRWTYPIGDHPTYPAISPLVVGGHYVYFVNIPYCVPGETCGNGSIVALEDKSGKEVGRYDWPEVWGGQIGVVDGPPVVNSALSKVAIGLGYQAAPDAYGGQVWIFHGNSRLSQGPIERLGEPSAGIGEVSQFAHKGGNAWPLLGGDYLAVQGPVETTRVWEMDANPPVEKWEIRFTRDRAHSIMPGGANPMLLEYSAGTGMVSAMYISTGKRIWSKPIKATGLSATAGTTVFVPGQAKHPTKAGATGRSDIQDGVLYALDTLTGKELWSIRRPDVTFNTPVPSNGRLYVSDTDGTLECYAVPLKPRRK